MTAKVFLSHAREDEECASRLTHALKHAEFDVYSDVDVPAGSDWGDYLRSAIDRADVMVILLSEASIRSGYVMTEVGAALAARKPIIPVIPPNRRIPHELPPPLRDAHLIRARHMTDAETAAVIHERLAA